MSATQLTPLSQLLCFTPCTEFKDVWMASLAAVFKLNVDASCDVLSDYSGLGVVVRNATGIAVFAAAVPLKFCADVEVAEARAILVVHSQSRPICKTWKSIQLSGDKGLSGIQLLHPLNPLSPLKWY
ncbi:hypothetical protein ACOSQ4_001269 [Xanthoceras sorbifolium]